MLLRLLFVLLIALNIAVAAWLLLGDSGTPAIDPNDGGVPKLKLLAELPEPAATTPAPATSARTAAPAAPEKSTSVALPAMPAKAASAPPVAPKPPATVAKADAATADAPNAPTSPRRSYRCLAIGPFANQVDLRAARGAIASRTVRSRQRQEQTSESRGWRVFLPAQPTREQALAQARRLEAKGIKDYFVVTAQGELQNSVALGLFHDPANARKRRDEVVAAGFPARMSERTETTPVWWLDVVVPEEAGGDIRRGIRTPGVAARTTGCF
ncbi:SPOR domain-containing protein [Luteibacter sp. 3190]|uniref:SPOR domain-containing protein n=1 Tax=Luteibacter sp. 3190 TaxID=2817736 RepID=UPI0028559BB7|nr:SPOR domain-containing protein [Luteibacter sp. 3190]MDR6936901.1 pyruvate/2-oxoglutarate dehydrogenase complex dihydrolipoamide acyltransferase (E2) component [Luteibacter sp. 3190]